MLVGSGLNIWNMQQQIETVDGAAVVSYDARSVCIANEMCMGHTSAFEGNMYIDDACMVCANVFE